MIIGLHKSGRRQIYNLALDFDNGFTIVALFL